MLREFEPDPIIYHIPENLPAWVAWRLAQRYGARPGDALLYFPGEEPPYTLQRDFDGNAAADLRNIIPYLFRLAPSQPREPSALPFHGPRSGRRHLERVK